MARDGARRACAGFGEFVVSEFVGLTKIEHQAVIAGILQREIEIGATDRTRPRERIAAGCKSGFKALREFVERRGAQIRDDLVAVAEIAIKAHRTCTERARDLAHSNRALAAFDIKRSRGLAYAGAKILNVFLSELAGH